jgi:tetratricopeptide (TPR) repeat protein
VVHRDIKPANVLLGAGNALISDFGISRAIAAAGGDVREAPGVTIGTPAYMAPEQIVGEESTDHRVDIYAAALVMYEMLEGRLPFPGDSASAQMRARLTTEASRVSRPDCSRDLADLIARCLAKDPAVRPQSADAALAELEEVLLGRSPASKRVLAYGLAGLVVATALFGASRVLIRPAAGPITEENGSRPAVRRYTQSPEAYEWYLRGMDLALMRTRAGAQQAREYFDLAIGADSSFSAAYAGLAMAYLSESGDVPGNHREAYALAEQAALRAVALDDSLAEAHVALGWARSARWEWAGAEQAFKRGIQLDERAPRALEGLARVYLWTERAAEQLTTAWMGIDVAPLSHSATRELALALAMNGRCDEALEWLRPLKTMSPPAGVAGVIAGQCHAANDRWQEAIDDFRWAMATDGAKTALAFLAYPLARAGQGDEAMTILSDLLAAREYSHGAFGIATVYAGLRDYDAAFTWLDRAVDENSVRPYLMGPMFEELRRDARFAGVRERMGLQRRSPVRSTPPA